MIVDDVFFNIDILKDVMRQVLKINVNEKVVEASDGKQALKQYIKLTKKYDNICPIELILMDCDMPVMNGFKATEMILKYAQIAIDQNKKELANDKLIDHSQKRMKLPVIIAITADTTEQNRRLAKKSGMKMMLSKPINSKDLKKILSDFNLL